MSTKDKTRQRLVGSMRKTKAVAGIGADNVDTGSVAEAIKPVVKAKAVAATNAERLVTSKTEVRCADTYQSGRRVWPD